MTPEQARLLNETHSSVTSIEANCENHRKTTTRHMVLLDGDNGEGLSTRMAVVEKSLKWVRAQFVVVVTSMLTFLAMAAKHLLAGK